MRIYNFVYNRVLADYNIILSKILYYWFLYMNSFRFCETYLLHIKLLVANQSAISPFLGVFERPRALTKKSRLKQSHGWDLLE